MKLTIKGMVLSVKKAGKNSPWNTLRVQVSESLVLTVITRELNCSKGDTCEFTGNLVNWNTVSIVLDCFSRKSAE